MCARPDVCYRPSILRSVCKVKEQSQHTIGVEFSSRTVKLGEKKVKLQVSQPSPRFVANGAIQRGGSYGILRDRSGSGREASEAQRCRVAHVWGCADR